MISSTYSLAEAGALDNSLDLMSESETSSSTGMSNLTAWNRHNNYNTIIPLGPQYLKHCKIKRN